MLQIQETEYAIGTIWDFLNESETEIIKSFYDVLIQYKDNKDLVTYLYSSMNCFLLKDTSIISFRLVISSSSFIEYKIRIYGCCVFSDDFLMFLKIVNSIPFYQSR